MKSFLYILGGAVAALVGNAVVLAVPSRSSPYSSF